MINHRIFLSANELITAAGQLITQEIASQDQNARLCKNFSATLGLPSLPRRGGPARSDGGVVMPKQLSNARLYAIMLPGGKTPLPLYRQLENYVPASTSHLRIFLSDERYVPLDHPQNNAQALWPLITAWGIPQPNFLTFSTSLPIEQAAAQYQTTMQRWLDEGTDFPLGFLGLGPDGHTASIFTKETPPPGIWATSTIAPNNQPRLTVTANLLGRIERLIFLVTNAAEKQMAIATLLRDPDSIPAGWATRRCLNREIWTMPFLKDPE